MKINEELERLLGMKLSGSRRVRWETPAETVLKAC